MLHTQTPNIEISWFFNFFPSLLAIENLQNQFSFEFLISLSGQISSIKKRLLSSQASKMIRYLLRVLGGSQVFKQLLGSDFRRVYKTRLSAFIYLNYFWRDSSKVSNIWEKYFAWVPKFGVSHISNSSIFKDNFHMLIFLSYLISKL